MKHVLKSEKTDTLNATHERRLMIKTNVKKKKASHGPECERQCQVYYIAFT